MSKPIKFDELRAVLEECAKRIIGNQFITFGNNLIYNQKLKMVFKDDEEIKLTKNEILFLELILKYKNPTI